MVEVDELYRISGWMQVLTVLREQSLTFAAALLAFHTQIAGVACVCFAVSHILLALASPSD